MIIFDIFYFSCLTKFLQFFLHFGLQLWWRESNVLCLCVCVCVCVCVREREREKENVSCGGERERVRCNMMETILHGYADCFYRNCTILFRIERRITSTTSNFLFLVSYVFQF